MTEREFRTLFAIILGCWVVWAACSVVALGVLP